MAQAALRHWTPDEFFVWQEKQAERYELVGGFPLRLMAGASNRHDAVALNLLVQLATKLRGSACRTFTADSSIETRPGQIRRPDAGVDCGERDPDAYKAASPVLVAEVLSPSTRDFDTFDKLAEYKAVASLRHILYVEPNAPEAVLWSRVEETGDWAMNRTEGLDGTVGLPGLGIAIAMSELYDGVPFRARPGAAAPDSGPS